MLNEQANGNGQGNKAQNGTDLLFERLTILGHLSPLTGLYSVDGMEIPYLGKSYISRTLSFIQYRFSQVYTYRKRVIYRRKEGNIGDN